MPFKIKYKFKGEGTAYACVVIYDQFTNLRKLSIIQECEIIKESKSIENYKNEMQRLNLTRFYILRITEMKGL